MLTSANGLYSSLDLHSNINSIAFKSSCNSLCVKVIAPNHFKMLFICYSNGIIGNDKKPRKNPLAFILSFFCFYLFLLLCNEKNHNQYWEGCICCCMAFFALMAFYFWACYSVFQQSTNKPYSPPFCLGS